MNKLAKVAVVVAGLALVAQAAKANDFDIILGFNGNGATSDYVINLGNANTSVGVGSGQVTDLSSFFNATTFNSIFTAGVNGTLMGAGGGQTSSSPTLYFTENRGAAGNASAALSLTPTLNSSSAASQGAGNFNDLPNTFSSFNSAGANLTIAKGDPDSWTSQVTSGNPGSFPAQTGMNPSSAIGSGVIYEDLWKATKNGTHLNWSYTGYLTFDDSGSSPLLTFTAVPVPEPSTYGLFGAAGVLVLALRRRFSQKNA